MTLHQRLTSDGPKRILALDGGGIRGVVTLGFLEEIESILAKRHPHIEDFRLCDYFDLIGGTSTGSIIAALLAFSQMRFHFQKKFQVDFIEPFITENFIYFMAIHKRYPSLRFSIKAE